MATTAPSPTLRLVGPSTIVTGTGFSTSRLTRWSNKILSVPARRPTGSPWLSVLARGTY